MIAFGLSLPVIPQVPAKTADRERRAAPRILEIARATDPLGDRHVTCSDHVLVAASPARPSGSARSSRQL